MSKHIFEKNVNHVLKNIKSIYKCFICIWKMYNVYEKNRDETYIFLKVNYVFEKC